MGLLGKSLGNMSVRLKLGLGFSIVLLLTIVITATGWLSVASLIDRGEKLVSISQISEQTTDLRSKRLMYEMQYNDEAAKALLASSTSSTH